ncbi:MAG: phosphoesterase, PHP-like protein [Myxococcaceae bacterium]|nr:phosphoesterase, PHP-like protein [Myxococcaceae bacterium]
MTDAKTVERALEDIALLLSFTDKGRFKAQAYERGAEIVAGLSFELGPVIESGRLTDIEGIGPSLSKQIIELWTTGSSSLLTRLRAENPPGAAELARVPGLTPKRIRALSEGLGIASLEQLRDACREQRVRGLPGFGAKTEQKLCESLASLERAANAERRILLSDALALGRLVERALREDARITQVVLAGGARRGLETLAELELVALLVDDAQPALDRERALERLADLPFVLRVDREHGSAPLVDGITLHLRVVPAAQAAATLLTATGPEAHVAELGARAAEHGLSLDDAMFDSESALYRALGLHEVPPELRGAPDVLAQAERDNFADLIQASDIRGMVHCHTTHSDGRNSIEEMARAAAELGMSYITITDHSPSAHYAHGVPLERLEQQWQEIREAEQRVGIRILRGTESDILADGNLDYPPDILARFDVVIASIHSRLRMTREQMTERLVNAMRQPVFKIWGHALGRLLLSREPIDCDVEAVLDALAASRGAIEVNGDPHRLDLPPEWIPKARARGIPFVLSVDAHSIKGLGVLPFAAQMARRGGVRREDVLNTLSADEFVRRVQVR